MALLLSPVARISPETAARIVPGMTVQQAVEIVGAKPGWCDGVGSLNCDAPNEMNYWQEWVGAAGSLILTSDARGNVATAHFYPAITVGQNPWNLVLERLTRRTRLQWEQSWERWWMYGKSE